MKIYISMNTFQCEMPCVITMCIRKKNNDKYYFTVLGDQFMLGYLHEYIRTLR